MKTKSRIWLDSLIIMGIGLMLTSCCKNDDDTNTDADGNVYTSVTIGTQVWMIENLKTTKFNDGTDIPLITDNTAWSNLTTPAYCWYDNNDLTYKTDYGALYNWYAVNTGKLCPIGWHVPSIEEWITLIDYLGGYVIASGKLIETSTTHWQSPHTWVTNETNFTALPGGYRWSDGTFSGINVEAYFLSSTADDGINLFIENGNSWIGEMTVDNNNGLSIRCIKD